MLISELTKVLVKIISICNKSSRMYCKISLWPKSFPTIKVFNDFFSVHQAGIEPRKITRTFSSVSIPAKLKFTPEQQPGKQFFNVLLRKVTFCLRARGGLQRLLTKGTPMGSRLVTSSANLPPRAGRWGVVSLSQSSTARGWQTSHKMYCHGRYF